MAAAGYRMKTFLKTFLLIAFLLASPFYAAAGDMETVLSSLPTPGSGPPLTGTVFRPDAKRISAAVVVVSAAKTKLRFSWYAPGGALSSSTVKISFPAPDSNTINASDSIEGPFAAGWWRLEVNAGDNAVSKEFLVTDSEATMVAAYGDRTAKLGVLENTGTGLPGYSDIIRLAWSDKDPDVRAGAVLAAARTGVDYAEAIIKSAASDGSEVVRSAAAQTAYALPDADREELLTRLAGDSSVYVRQNTAKALGDAGATYAAGELGRLIADRDWMVRDAALDSLAGLKGDAAVEALSEGLSVKDTAFREKVLREVLKKSGRSKVSVLTGALADPDPGLRLLAFKGLVEEGAGWPAEKALPLIDDPEEDVAASAFDMLAGTYPDATLDAGLVSRHVALRSRALECAIGEGGPLLAGRLETAVKDGDPGLRRRAVGELAGLGDAGAKGLVEALGDAEPGIRIKAAAALAELKPPEAENAMVKSLNDEDAEVRRLAVKYFANVGGPAKYGVFEGAATDKSRSVRNEGLAALLADDDMRSSRSLGVYYVTGNTKDRHSVIEELSKRGDSFALETLRSALDDSDTGIRLMAVKALGDSGDVSDISRLALDPDKDVRLAALRVLKSVHDPGNVPVLEQSLRYPDPGVRYAALEALSGIPGAEAGRAVSSMMYDPSAEVREFAVRLVLAREDAGVRDGLVGLLGDPRPDVRAAASGSLVKLTDAGVDETLVGVVRDGSKPARLQAFGILRKRGSALFPDAVVMAISDRDAGLRKAGLAAVPSLDEVGQRRAYIAASSSPDTDTRLAGVEGLSGVEGDGVAGALAGALSDSDSRIRKAAVIALARSRPDYLYPRLEALVTDPDYSVARAAFDAGLKSGRPPEINGMLVSAALGPHDDMAREALDRMLTRPGPDMLPVFEKYYEKGYRRRDILYAAASIPGDDATEFIGGIYRQADTDRRMKFAAVRSLGGRGQAALPYLVDALGDSSRDIRLEAVRSISGLGGGQGAREALAQALTDQDETVRSASLDALVAGYGPGSARLILPALEDSKLAGRALKAISSPGDAEAAYYLLKAGPTLGPDLRASASGYLGDMDVKSVKSGIEEHFEDNTAGAALLGFAAESITDAGLLGTVAERVPATDTQRLRALMAPLMKRREPKYAWPLLEGLKSIDSRLRGDILLALAGLEHDTAVDAMKHAMERYPGLGSAIVDVSSRRGLAADIVGISLKSESAETRLQAVEALYGQPCIKAEPALLAALKDAELAVRLAAARVAQGSGCVAALLSCAMDSSPEVRAAAAYGLGGHNEQASVETLAKLAMDADADVRKPAMDSLLGLGGAVPAGVWTGLAASSQDKVVRLTAIGALAANPDDNYAPVFVKALEDGDNDISAAGRDGLAALGAGSLGSVHPLLDNPRTRDKALEVIGMVDDPSSEIPVAATLPGLEGTSLNKAVEVLGRLGGAASLEPLSRVYSRGDPRVKISVLRAVSGLKLSGGEPALVGLLKRALEEPDDQLRFYAARAAGELRVSGLKDVLKDALAKEKSRLVSGEMEKAVGML